MEHDPPLPSYSFIKKPEINQGVHRDETVKFSQEGSAAALTTKSALKHQRKESEMEHGVEELRGAVGGWPPLLVNAAL